MAFTIQGTPANGDVFDAVPSTRSLSAFDMLDRAAGALKTPLRSAAQIKQGVADSLRDLDAVFGTGAVGARLRRRDVEPASTATAHACSMPTCRPAPNAPRPKTWTW